jgi:hypothetical protein
MIAVYFFDPALSRALRFPQRPDTAFIYKSAFIYESGSEIIQGILFTNHIVLRMETFYKGRQLGVAALDLVTGFRVTLHMTIAW